MNSNIFSIDTHVVVSERNFTRLNNWLRENGFVVEEIPYAEIAKQEGLLRCTTLPLMRIICRGEVLQCVSTIIKKKYHETNYQFYFDSPSCV
jgi:hypothetical protein